MTPPRRLTAEEQQRILEQQSSGYDDRYRGYRISDRPDPSAGTSPVSPSADPSGRAITWANQGGVDTGTTKGRGNIHGPSGFMTPRVPGGNAPAVPQLIGSNLELPPLSEQYPPQTLRVPKSLVPEALRDDSPAYPTLASSGIQRDIPQDIATAGVRPQKVTSQILREGSE